MTSSPPPNRPDPEELLLHAAWLRRFARALALDDAAADDLVQDAFGAALTARRPIRDLRAFLGGALRRRSSEVRRSELRRRRREESVAADHESALPSADEAAERVETMRILLEELQRLPAAQRGAVTLRFVDGLEPGDIAERTGLAPATVRAHVARGLAALRERLDRRCGGRASWTAAFAPWIGVAVPDATSGAGLERTVQGAAKTAVPGGALGLAFTSGVALMSTKIALAAFAAVTLLGLWYGLERAGDGAGAPVASHAAPVALDDVLMAPDAPLDGERRETIGEATIAPPFDSASDDSIEKEAGFTVAGTVVDALTGEPVPSMTLVLEHAGARHAPALQALQQHPGGDDPHAGLDEKQMAAYVQALGGAQVRRTVEVETDTAGAFDTEQELPAGTVIVVERDDLGGLPTLPRRTAHTFPFDGPLPVHVGPTFHFGTPLPAGVAESSLRARFLAGRGTGFRPPATTVRAGALPWVRFPYSVTRLTDEGPWKVEVSDDDGLWLAETSVARKAGIERVPLALEFRAFGALEFAIARDDGKAAPITMVEVGTAAGEPAQRVYLERDGASVARGRARLLAPGPYRWTAGPEGGEALVVAGEVTAVAIDVSYGSATFDAEVTIDASAVSDDAVRACRFVVVDVNNFANAFPVEPERAEDDPAGQWRLVLRDIPAGTWSLVPTSGPAPVLWEPRRVVLEVGRAPEGLVAYSRSAEVPVRLIVRDAQSGESIPGAEAAWNTTGADYSVLTANDSGEFSSHGVPEDEESHVLVRAQGYRMASVRVVPRDDGRTALVELERGWRNLVRVMWTDDFTLASDVEVVVDGASAGRTAENGLVWLEGVGPPELIELGADAPAVVMSPFEPPGVFPPDPLLGWTFLVRRP